MIYAQAEDDFIRVETITLTPWDGRRRRKGNPAVYQDLRMKLFIDPEDLKKSTRKARPGCRR